MHGYNERLAYSAMNEKKRNYTELRRAFIDIQSNTGWSYETIMDFWFMWTDTAKEDRTEDVVTHVLRSFLAQHT